MSERVIRFRIWDRKTERYSIHIIEHSDKDIPPEQFTGLLDKNGVEIYEGDLYQDELDAIWLVYWDEHDFSFSMKYVRGSIFPVSDDDTPIPLRALVSLEEDDGEFTHIGNVHKNSELLETNNAQ